jgi:hypothetical protein
MRFDPPLCAAVTLPASNAFAQQKQHVSLKSSVSDNKITQAQNVEVGDVPNHIVRVFEVRRTFPNAPPVINGLKLVEEWDRGTVDLIDGNGTNLQYNIYVMENGDKFFSRVPAVIQTAGGKLTGTGVGIITGGTGKLTGLQGTVHALTNFDIKTGFTENQTNVEYVIDK